MKSMDSDKLSRQPGARCLSVWKDRSANNSLNRLPPNLSSHPAVEIIKDVVGTLLFVLLILALLIVL